MIKYNNTNNASTTLTAGISASSTTLIVENGDILPTAPFLLTLEHFDNEKVTVREIVKCIAKAGNILTIQRGAGTCVQDDSASTKEQGNSAHSFSVGDCASIYWTSEQVQDIQNEIEKKLNIDDFQAGTYVYGATSTETDAYSITIPGTLTSYAVGQVFRFMADVDNEGNATLNINGLGAVEIRKNHDKILDNGDIEAGQIVEVAYDGTYFQMDSQVATVVDVASLGNTQYKTGVAGEDLEVGDVCCLVDFENDYFEMKLFGTTESSVEYEVIGNGGNDNSITLWLGRRGNSSGEDLVVELLDGETVIASSQIARSGLTENTTVETVCSWGENVETEKGKAYTLRLRTYDNSVDADKGFYVNRGNGTNQWYRTDINVKSDPIVSVSNNVYLNFSIQAWSGYNSNRVYGDVTLTGENDTIVIKSQCGSYDYDTMYVAVVLNGTEIFKRTHRTSGYSPSFKIKENKIIVDGTTYQTNSKTYKITNVTYNGTGYNGNYLLKMVLTTNSVPYQFINHKTNNFRNSSYYKGSSKFLRVNTTVVEKGGDCTMEIGGYSNVWNVGRFVTLFNGGMLLGYSTEEGQLKYKPKYYRPLPTINTDFYLLKNAVMFIQGNLNGSKIKKDGFDYITFPNTDYLVELTLEGGHTYQIDFNPNLIKEFYFVD